LILNNHLNCIFINGNNFFVLGLSVEGPKEGCQERQDQEERRQHQVQGKKIISYIWLALLLLNYCKFLVNFDKSHLRSTVKLKLITITVFMNQRLQRTNIEGP